MDDLATRVPITSVRLSAGPEQSVARLRRRMQGSLCGLTQSLAFMHGPRSGPRVMCAGGDMTGVHVLRDQPPPKVGSYHIGGYGILPFESHIRTLGETVERYAGYVAAVSGRFPVTFRSYSEMVADGVPVLDRDGYRFFTQRQLERPGFPFTAFTEDSPIGWIRVGSLLDDRETYLPAQLFLVGYVIQDSAGEPWLNAAVTTGTAAHTTGGAALLGALQEAIQLDAAIGHWHGTGQSVRITPDARTHALYRIIREYLPARAADAEFHLLPSADLPGHVVACLLRSPDRQFPAVVVGMGVDGRLGHAMYKALLEATGVRHLAVVSAINDQAGEQDYEKPQQAADEDFQAYDLESNVIRYGLAKHAAVVERRFADCTDLPAGDLPPDDDRPYQDQVRDVVRAYRDTGKRLYYADLTTADLHSLGFVVSRIWSPDTLSLPLPAAPAAAHPRFGAYGGFQHDDPHPYP